MTMAERIRRARRAAKLSQAQLAQHTNVQRSAVSNWESSSNTFPTMRNLIAMSHVCNVSIEWLGTGRGSMNANISASDERIKMEYVDSPNEKELLACFRSMPNLSQALVLDLAKLVLTSGAKRGQRKLPIQKNT